VLASLLNPNDIIEKGGLFLVAAIIFAESCLVFFLPGDALLFITGFLATKPEGLPHINQPIAVVVAVLFVAALLGNQVGYLLGSKVGVRLFGRPNSRLFSQKNLDKSREFFERHGSKTIVMARFVPVVRTFAPIVAGISAMKYRTFITYNLVGAALWAVGVTLLGYFLGEISWIKNNIEIAAIGIVALSLLPVAYEVMKHRKAAKAH
jgi:membrane-associated protein